MAKFTSQISHNIVNYPLALTGAIFSIPMSWELGIQAGLTVAKAAGFARVTLPTLLFGTAGMFLGTCAGMYIASRMLDASMSYYQKNFPGETSEASSKYCTGKNLVLAGLIFLAMPPASRHAIGFFFSTLLSSVLNSNEFTDIAKKALPEAITTKIEQADTYFQDKVAQSLAKAQAREALTI